MFTNLQEILQSLIHDGAHKRSIEDGNICLYFEAVQNGYSRQIECTLWLGGFTDKNIVCNCYDWEDKDISLVTEHVKEEIKSTAKYLLQIANQFETWTLKLDIQDSN